MSFCGCSTRYFLLGEWENSEVPLNTRQWSEENRRVILLYLIPRSFHFQRWLIVYVGLETS